MAAAQPIAQLAEHLNRGRASASSPAGALAHKAQALMTEGLDWPSSREEAWRYTPIANITTPLWRRADAPAEALETPAALQAITGAKLVFVDGHLHAAWSTDMTGTGVWVTTLAQAQRDKPEWLDEALGTQGLHTRQSLAALNTASLTDGAVVHVAPKARLPEALHVVYLQTGANAQPTVVQPRTLLVLGHHAEATVWEHYLGDGAHVTWTNAVTEVRLGEGAQLSHITVQTESKVAMHTSTLSAQVGAHARLAAFAYSQGGASARREMHVHLDGEGAEVNLAGLYLAQASAHHDFQVNVHHNKPHTQSTQNFRGILRDHTTGVFSGTVYVAPGAAKTNAKQLCRSLLLSAQARAHAQPRLEILTDDVKCAHGATVGELDDDALFYLQSRGLDMVQAQRLLTYAFAAEALADAPKSSYATLAQSVRTHMGLTDLGDSAC